MGQPYTIFFPDGRVLSGEAAGLGKTPTFDGINRAIHEIWKGYGVADHGEIERVNVWHEGKYRDMFVDEMGAMKGLPVNLNATAVYHANQLHHVHGDPPAEKAREIARDWPKIYGVAVLFHNKVWR
jgi:hypothetical protein